MPKSKNRTSLPPSPQPHIKYAKNPLARRQFSRSDFGSRLSRRGMSSDRDINEAFRLWTAVEGVVENGVSKSGVLGVESGRRSVAMKILEAWSGRCAGFTPDNVIGCSRLGKSFSSQMALPSTVEVVKRRGRALSVLMELLRRSRRPEWQESRSMVG